MGNIFDILLNQPLGALMRFFYGLFGNYAVAIFFFALAVKLILIPLGIKQQNSQRKMAKIRPKEQAIRGKYSGRTDQPTQQKMQQEIMAMYKSENYSPMAGCLPLLVQLPVIFALFNIIRNPLTYISQLSSEAIDKIKTYILENWQSFTEYIPNIEVLKDDVARNLGSIPQIKIVEIFNGGHLNEITRAVPEIPSGFENVDYNFFGQMLTSAPSQAMLSVLMLIPILNFAASFLQMRLQKIINSKTTAQEVKGMKFMEYTFPLLIIWMSFTMESALGLYWIFQAILGIAQMIILAKLLPLPVITEQEYELARQQYGGTGTKKKKKKKPVETTESAEAIESAESAESEEKAEDIEEEESGETQESEESEKEKYISKTIPQGINPAAKSNYQKTGQKYKINRKRKK